MSESKTYECILVEFVNESGSYGVGFIEWLLDEELRLDTAKLEHAIASKSETSIKWPVSCDPLIAKKKADCEFKKHVVVLFGFGEWADMYERMNSMIKFGDPNPKKADRKLHAKRNVSSGNKRQQKPTQDEKIRKAGSSAAKVSSKESTKQQQAKQKGLLAEYLQLKAEGPSEIDSKSSDEENKPLNSEESKRNHSSDDAQQPKVTQAGKRRKAGPPAIKVSCNESAERGKTKPKVLLVEYLQLKAEGPSEINSKSSDEESKPLNSEESKRNHSSDDAQQPKVTQAGKRRKAGPPAIKVSCNESAEHGKTKQKVLLAEYLQLKAEGPSEINSKSSDEESKPLNSEESKRNHSSDDAQQPKVTQAGKRRKAGPPAIKVSCNESAERGKTKQKVLLAEYLQLKAEGPSEINSKSSDEESKPLNSEESKRNHSSDDAQQPKVTQTEKRKKAGPPAIKVIPNKSAKRQQTKQNFLLRGDLELEADSPLEINSESSDEDNRHLTKQELMNKLRMMKYDEKKLKRRLQINELGSIINSDLPAFKRMSSEILSNLHTALKISTSLAQKVVQGTDKTENVEKTGAVREPATSVSDCRVFTPSPQVKKDVKTLDLEKLQVNFHTERQKSSELIEKKQKGQCGSEQSNHELEVEKLEENKQTNNESRVEQTYSDGDFEVVEKELRNDAGAFPAKEHERKAELIEYEDKNVPDKKHQSEPGSALQQKKQHHDGEDNDSIDNELDNKEEMVVLGPGVLIEKTRLLACNHENFRTLSNGIVGAVFSMEELATSSLTGSAANFIKTKAAKKKLDPRKLSACLDYIKAKFPEFPKPEETFKTLTRRKCNNAATNRKVFIK